MPLGTYRIILSIGYVNNGLDLCKNTERVLYCKNVTHRGQWFCTNSHIEYLGNVYLLNNFGRRWSKNALRDRGNATDRATSYELTMRYLILDS